MKNLRLLAVGVFVFSLKTFAGTEGHGGNAVVCRDPQTHRKTTVMLDYYHAKLGTFGHPESDMTDIENASEQQVIGLFRSRLVGRQFSYKLKHTLDLLGPVSSWILADLKDVDDSKEPYLLPKWCVRKTAAIRQDDHEMFIDKTVSSHLASAQFGILRLHEALYYLATKHGLTTSEKVRDLIREVFLNHRSEKKIDAAIEALGGVTDVGTIYDSVNRTYESRDKTVVDLGGYPRQFCLTSNEEKSTVLLRYSCDHLETKANVLLHCKEDPFICRGVDDEDHDVVFRAPLDNAYGVLLSGFLSGKNSQTFIFDAK